MDPRHRPAFQQDADGGRIGERHGDQWSSFPKGAWHHAGGIFGWQKKSRSREGTSITTSWLLARSC
jgi:hypothetical protein